MLIDWNPRYLYRQILTDEEAVERFLAEVCDDVWNRQMDAGRPFADGVAELVARHPNHQASIEAYWTRWPEMLGGPIHGTVALLEALHAKGERLLALSNWSAETFALVRRDPAYAFLDRFERIFVSGEEAMIKPDARFFQLLLDRSGLEAADCLFIDDNADNIEAARAMGFAVHHFTHPEALRRDLAAQGLVG